MSVLASIHVNTVRYVLSEHKHVQQYNGSVCQALPAAKLWDNIKNIYVTVFPHSIDDKIVVSENAEWLITLENH